MIFCTSSEGLCTFRTPCQQQFLPHIITSGVVPPVTFFALLFLTSALTPLSSATSQSASASWNPRPPPAQGTGEWCCKSSCSHSPELFQPEGQASSRVVAKGQRGAIKERLEVSSALLQLRLGFAEADNEAWSLS